MHKLCNKLSSSVNESMYKTVLLINFKRYEQFLNCIRKVSNRRKIEQFGTINQCNTSTNYNIGQTFLHRVFAYRGIILYPWQANIYERNTDAPDSVVRQDIASVSKKSVPRYETYYQVLVDSRDSSHLNWHSCEAVTFSPNPNAENRPLFYTIPGIDYVSHEDIIPYTSCEDVSIHHDLFEKFLKKSGKSVLQTTDIFNKWQKKNHTCLELSNVHRETTENIRVTVIPFYLGAEESRNQIQPSEYWWRYCIRIENLGNISTHLRESHLRIITNGTVSTRRGLGIMGKEPVLNRELPAFQQSSRPLSLQTSSGQMWGTFRLEKDDGEQFDVRIPAFSLDSKVSLDSDSTSTSN